MTTVSSYHKRLLSVPDAFKAAVKSGKRAGGEDLKQALEYFTKKIEEVELKVVDSTEIVEFLVTNNDENLVDNYYYLEENTKTRRIRTAVVRCNFTDSETLMRSVEANCKNHKAERVILSSHATSVKGVIEEIREKNRHTIVVIEQLESMDADIFNRLISLLSFHEDLDVSLLVCLSTSRSVLDSYCAMDNMELMMLKYFPLESPERQFDMIIDALTRNNDKHAPNLYISGELLLVLKKRFLRGDFSLAELKKTVRLSIVQNFMMAEEYDEMEDDFPETLPAYWGWFDELLRLIEEAHSKMDDEGKPPSLIDVHCDLQNGPQEFWSDNRHVKSVQNYLLYMNREELCATLTQLAEAVKQHSPKEAESLLDRAAQLREEGEAAATATTSTPTPATPSSKMSMTELLAENRAKQAAKAASGNKLKEAVQAIMKMMKGQVFSWKQHDYYLLCVPEGIEVPDLSRSLSTRSDKQVSQAYCALAGIDQFKPVSTTRWGELVADSMDNGAFYDAVAQLERMGVIKDVSKQGKKAVQLQMRPMHNFN